MSIIAKSEGTFEQPPTGMVQAVCAFVHDIGTHVSDYQGKQNVAHKIIVSWELSEKMTTGDYADLPFMMSKYYTLSLNEKANLRKDLESWRGKQFDDEELKGFDVEKLVGANCLLNLTKNSKDKVIISAITPLTKGMAKMDRVNKEPSEKFMEWINRERGKSLEMQDAQPNHAVEPQVPMGDDSGLPF